MNDAISLQYCEYGPDPAKCYEWMKVNLPEHYVRLVGGGIIYMKMHVHTRSTCPLFMCNSHAFAVGSQMEGLSLGESKRQTRGTVNPIHKHSSNVVVCVL